MAQAGEVWVKISARDAGLKAGLNRAKADTAAAAQSMNSSMGSVKSMLMGLGLAYAAQRAGRFIMDAAIEQDAATTSMNSALAKQGKYTTDASKDLAKYANQLQATTVYSNDMIQAQMALAMNMGVPAGRIKEVTTAAVGLAATIKKDVPTAMGLMVRAMNGNTAMLTRYGIALDTTKSKEEQFEQLLKIGAQGMRTAADDTKSATGQMAQFKNSVGDLAKKVGALLLPALMLMAGGIKTFVDWLNEGRSWVVGFSIAAVAAIAVFKGLVVVINIGTKAWAEYVAWQEAAAAGTANWGLLAVKTGAAIAAFLAVMALWGSSQKKLEEGFASIQNAASKAWTDAETSARKAEQQMSGALDDPLASFGKLADATKAMFKPPPADDALKKRAEELADLVQANREEAQAERERQRAMIGWTGLSDLWKKAMVTGQQERFGAKGYGIYDRTKKELARMAGAAGAVANEAPNMAFVSEIRRAEERASVRDQRRDNLLQQIFRVISVDQQRAITLGSLE